MENITIGQIVSAIGILSVIGAFLLRIHFWLNKAQEDRDKQHQEILNVQKQVIDLTNSLNEKIDEINISINKRIDDFEFNTVKSAIINYMCLANLGEITIEQRKKAHEDYDWYVNHNGNSYVKDEWERLVKEGKI